MIRQIIWKEWHENRSKYIGYWVTLYVPMILLSLGIAFTNAARVPFADLNDAMVWKYLPLSLIEGVAVLTIFAIFTGYLAVATFSPELDDRSVFFIYEQGVSRVRYLAAKLVHGGAQVAIATFSAVVTLPVASYLMMLASGKVSSAGSGAAFSTVMVVAARAGVWCALISLAVFMASALIAALVPRWWLASICSVAATVAFITWGLDYFRFLPDMDEGSMSIGFGFSSDPAAKWITISRAFKPQEIKAIALWWPGPLISTIIATAVFCAATVWLYRRKQLT